MIIHTFHSQIIAYNFHKDSSTRSEWYKIEAKKKQVLLVKVCLFDQQESSFLLKEKENKY